ncbi:hypothetical protein [Paramicrobacterium chengjingii]|uniref:hypothetical protein n=1 Tax=Paramicrobacterium chengjingii TaxID=2769067 RepID=UPI0014249171|nr:hypothetical protein [Microbacterium chengjingii]
MWHLVFVSLHAALATVALVAGVLGLRHPRLLPVHLWSIIGMSLALPFSVVAGWAGFTAVTRPIFVALVVLSCFMVIQAFRANRASRSDAHWRIVVNCLGFNIIGLTTGFLAVAVLRMGAGPAVVILVAVGVPVVGHFCVRWLRNRVVPRTKRAATAPAAGDPITRR